MEAILLFCASLEKIPFTFSKWSHFLLKITIMYGSLLVKLNLRGPDLLRGFPYAHALEADDVTGRARRVLSSASSLLR